MYKTEGLCNFIRMCVKTKESDEFLKNRELLARGMDFYTKREVDTLILYTKNEEFGRYYVDNTSD